MGNEQTTHACQLQIQRGAEDDRVGTLEHLGRLVELVLQLGVADHFGGLAHLADELLQTTEDADQASFELVRELW